MAVTSYSEPLVAPPEEVAEQAGLRYVCDRDAGIRRVKAGRGFAYRRADGTLIRDPEVKARIAALAIPPAWTDVWICTDPVGHVQATGRDQKGRKQYRYHNRWREVRDGNKFDRLLTFGQRLPDLRARVDEDLRRGGLERDQVLALVVRLLDETLIRVGNPEYAADNDTFGLTTLRADHVDLSPRKVMFDFVGKAGVEHQIAVEDARLARLVRRCHELGGQELFAYRAPGGEVVDVTSSDVNAYVREVIGADTSAKDFRTWGGTVIAAEHLAGVERPETVKERESVILGAFDEAASMLGNTRAVCRSCYVHPAVPDSFRDGSLEEQWKRARTTTHHRRAERATLGILERAGSVGDVPCAA